VICSTNAIESLNARYRRPIKARGHFPSGQAAMKCLYLVTPSLDPTGVGRARWTMRWNQRSARSRSPSATDSRQPKPTDGNRRKHR
jgi:transposase-like protein